MILYIIFCLFTTIEGAGITKILIGDRESLYRLNTVKNVSTALIRSDSPQSMDYDFTRGYIYYVDSQSQLRRLSSRSEGKTVTLNAPRADLNDVIVDWLNNKLYLIRNGRTTLSKTNSRGMDSRDIIDREALGNFEGTIARDDSITMKHLEVDPYNKVLFISIMEVSLSQHFYTIAKTNLNGEYLRPQRINGVQRTFRYFITFTVDISVKRLYVAGKQRISVCNYEGESLDVMIIRTEFIQINVFQNTLYGLVKESRNDVFKVELESSNKNNLQLQKLPSDVKFDQILSFQVYDPRPQRRARDGDFVCDRLDCSHSCKVLPEFGDSCTCEKGKVIAIDGRTCQECGRSGMNSYVEQPTIYGGNFSKPGDFPWHTVLFHLQEGKWNSVCGGTLVSQRMILTAAHCVTVRCDVCKPSVMSPNDVMVALGKNNRFFDVEEENEVKKRVKSIRVHELFLGTAVSYGTDIAVLEMESDVVFNQHVMPACVDFNLNYYELLYEDKTLEGFVAGFGNTKECGTSIGPCDSPSETLKYATTNIISFEECFNRSQALDKQFFFTLTDDKFCSGNGSRSVIQQMDSGGGLTFVFDNGLHFIYGIVSTKLSKVKKNVIVYSFGTFTNVVHYLDWLKKQIQ